MEENMIVTRDSKTFCFNFDWPKDVDLKHEIHRRISLSMGVSHKIHM